MRVKCVNACFGLCLIASCTIDPNIENQTSTQRVDGRVLTVGFVDGFFDPAPFETPDGEVISPFPIVGSGGILVRDESSALLAEGDRGIARQAAETHCAEFRQTLEAVPGVFYPAEAGWGFGRCVT